MSTDFKFSKELVEFRRAKVLELAAQAVPQSQIAQKLGVSPATISLDMQYLRESAKSKIRNHIEDTIPAQYQECQAGLKLILRKTCDIVDDKSKRTEEQLAAMSLAVNIYGKLMDLSTNGAILEKTTKWLAQKKEQLTNTEKVTVSEDEAEKDLQNDVKSIPNYRE